jgi:predicted alpha-1,2-mannosidase
VDLPQDRVRVELTATPRVGVHRYTFKKGEQPHLLLEVTSALGGRGRETGAATVLLGANEVVGRVTEYGSFSGRYDGLDAFFVARFSRPFAGFGTWEGDRFSPGATEVEGKNIGVDLAFEVPAGQPAVVEARVAISYVSVANARMNLEAEAASRTFEEVFAGARDAWEKQLSVIDVQGGTERQQRIFYTSLYHAFVMPTVFNDVNDEYKGFDKETHKAEGFRYFTAISLWDTFRTVQPLYNLIARADQRDIMVSLVEMAKAGGCLPRWPSGAGYTNCMFGTPADVAVSEAYQKGIRDFDIETAYSKMRETALTGKPEGSKFAGREGLEGYLEYGYCPSDEMKRESVACTLEFGWADYAIAQLARELGRAEDAELFAKRAQGYKNLWNPETLFFEGRDTKGSFPEERNPRVLTYTDFGNRYASAYVEGSGWQWRWAVPYDPQGLISLFPNREYFVEQLEEFLENTRSRVGWWNPGPYYWHGNEHDIHAAYLFNEAGRPDLTQKWVRRILETKYSDDYVGLDGNDDGGTLSAWYVLSALGFYPIAGTTRYELGSPLFDAAELRIDGKALKIVAENNGPDNVYVQQVWLNDAPLDRTWFTHDEIAEGGTLRFKMGPAPSAAKPAA